MIQFAYAADGTTAAGAGNMTSTIIMIVVMIAIFYFLLIRPENKRKKQAEEMRNSLKKGDWLTTIGRHLWPCGEHHRPPPWSSRPARIGSAWSSSSPPSVLWVRWISRWPPPSALPRSPRVSLWQRRRSRRPPRIRPRNKSE